MTDFRIPKRFRLLGQSIEVVMDPQLVQDRDQQGRAEYRFNQIKIQPSIAGQTRKDEAIAHTFCHELMHWVLYYAGYDYEAGKKDLHADEKLVDLCGGLLHQALTTMEYDDG